jgi:UDP-glucuronate 4-epimerase
MKRCGARGELAPDTTCDNIPRQTQMNGRGFLLTGGAGFIGSHVARALLDSGASVVVVDDLNDFYSRALKEYNLRPFHDKRTFRFCQADIRDPLSLRRVFEAHAGRFRSGGVLHFAARAGVRPSLTEPRLYLETNVAGTLNLAELAREFGVAKVVFASSSSVYGESPERVPFREDQDVSRPISPYASTKVMAESLLHAYSHLYGLQVVCLRFFTVYGPAQRPDLAIHKFTRLIERGLPIPVYGDGSTRRDYTYIDDVLHGVLAAIDYQASPFEVFNLGESRTVSLAALIELLESALGRKAQVERLPLQPGDVSVTCADVTKAGAHLGYRPTTAIEAGIPRWVEWYRSAAREGLEL